MRAGQPQQQPDPFKHIADEYRQIRAGKTQAKLVDPAELPRRQKGVRQVDEGFWRQSTSTYAAPPAAKKRRKQTLEKAPRKAIRVAKPGRQAENLITILQSGHCFPCTSLYSFWSPCHCLQAAFRSVSTQQMHLTPAHLSFWSFDSKMQNPSTFPHHLHLICYRHIHIKWLMYIDCTV